MSDKMYDEIIIDGKPYEKGDWKKFSVQDEFSVKGFFGEYRFLSNFQLCERPVWGLYPTVENAYQAMKVDPDVRSYFYKCSASESKKNWRIFCVNEDYPTSEDWDAAKYDIMFSAVFDKFLRNKNLRDLLIETKHKYLEETNWWGDEYWGVNCFTKQGQNKLGGILMTVRDILRLRN